MSYQELLFNKYNKHTYFLHWDVKTKIHKEILEKFKQLNKVKDIKEYEQFLFDNFFNKENYVIYSALFFKIYKKELYPISLQLEFMLNTVLNIDFNGKYDVIFSYDESLDVYLVWYEFFQSKEDEIISKKKRICVFCSGNYKIAQCASNVLNIFEYEKIRKEKSVDYSKITEFVKEKLYYIPSNFDDKKIHFIDKFISYSQDEYYESKNFKNLFTQKIVKKDKKENLSNIKLEDVVGLDDVKKSIEEKILLPIKHKELYEKYDKQTGGGILLYGLPGTGKTMFAKAIANEIDAQFFSVKPGDLKNMFVGESEKLIKELFTKARSYKKSIIFFDEFESIGGKRTNRVTRPNVSNILVPELLAQIQGINKEENENENELLLIIAATNRPQDIDSALLRPGRFDTKIYVDLPD